MLGRMEGPCSLRMVLLEFQLEALPTRVVQREAQ